MQQTTIARAVEWRGIGLHSGRPASVVVLPGPVDSGLVFVPVGEDGVRDAAIPAHPTAVHSTSRATTLAAPVALSPASGPLTGSRDADGKRAVPERARVTTVEHLLASLYVLGIHNARIEVTGGEIPALDGSAAPFVARLRRVGRRMLGASRRELEVTRVLRVGDDRRWIRIEPGEGLQIAYSIDFPHPLIGRQCHALPALDASRFDAELAPARTFGFADEVEQLHAQGLARGGDLSNTLVVGDEGLLNPEGLRFPDEFVRHKVVDLLGDLALLGGELHARITVERGGHGLHHLLVRALADTPGLLTERTPHAVGGRRQAAAQPR